MLLASVKARIGMAEYWEFAGMIILTYLTYSLNGYMVKMDTVAYKKYSKMFEHLENEAKEKSRGIWSGKFEDLKIEKKIKQKKVKSKYHYLLL